MLAEQRPDVLLLDLELADAGGRLADPEDPGPARGGRGSDPGRRPRRLRAGDRTRALLAGFQLQLIKPVRPAELVAAVASLAGRTPKPAEAQEAALVSGKQGQASERQCSGAGFFSPASMRIVEAVLGRRQGAGRERA